MNPIRRFRRFAAALAGLAGGLLSFAVAAPAAFARPAPPLGQPFPPRQPLPPGWDKHPPLPPTHVHQVVHTVVVGGMPGWQIAQITAAAALIAATVAELLDRARAAHQTAMTAAT